MKRYLVALFLFGLSVSGFAQTQCAAFPCVVASVALTNQTTSVSQVPVYTPAQSGMFRVSYYEESAPIVGSSWIFTWNWTDDTTTRSYGPFTLSRGSYFNAGVPGMWVTAGQPITYTVTKGRGGLGSYNLYATVEQIQ
jgi:hypothetical protein